MPEDHQQQVPPLVPAEIVVKTGEPSPALAGGYCPACRSSFFPRPRFCPQCLKPVDLCELNGEGAIYSYTVVRTKPPLGLPQPYAVGYVDLNESGLRIFGLFDPAEINKLAIGLAVRLKTGPMGINNQGESCLRPYFSLMAEENDHG